MAVYKATYCYPFLNAVDLRVGLRDGIESVAEYLKCKVDTSNKNVTGYRIRLLDSNNNVIFPIRIGSDSVSLISPISELGSLMVSEDQGVNSGINGTEIKIPFFQNANSLGLMLDSINAIYYLPKFTFDRIIMNAGLDTRVTAAENVDNWTLESGYMYYLDPSTQQRALSIMIDGEAMLEGDMVLVASSQSIDSAKVGIWKTVKKYLLNQPYLALEQVAIFAEHSPADNQPETDDMITIMHGTKFHNTTWKYDGNHIYSRVSQDANLWSAYNDAGALSPLNGLTADCGTLKWEITLYQGKGTISSGSAPRTISYNNLDNEWFDMTIGSGKILGSTPQRIQVASDDAEGTDIYLPKGLNSTLILQTRYIDMMNLYNQASGTYNPPSIFNGTRTYVQTYDSTYGHAYPLSDALESTVVDSSTHAQFFKHSNNPEEILNTDIVDFGTNQYIQLDFYSSVDFQQYNDEQSWRAATNPSNRILVVHDASTLPANIIEGNTILLTNQQTSSVDLRKQNGVYYYYELTHTTTVGETTTTTTYKCLNRATSYMSWSAYIGKIIYCSNGVLRGNQESLANAGTFTLWNPASSSDGDSKLLFTSELPILLFPQKLGANCTFALFDSQHPRSGDKSVITIDGQDVNVGDLILYNDYNVGIVKTVGSSGYTIDSSSITVGDGTLFYILGGQEYGHRVWKAHANAVPTQDWAPFTAKILKNSHDHTYISPMLGLQKGMKLKLTNNKKVLYTDPAELSEWISVLDIDSVSENGAVFRIKHNSISPLSPGVENKNNGDYGLVSYSPENNPDIPWKYEVRTYFKASDENAFYAFENPYLILYKDGSIYTDIGANDRWGEFDVLNGSSSSESIPLYVVDAESSGSYSQFMSRYFIAGSTIHGRSLNLSARYVQFQQASWESYRWVLYDRSGDIIQDTGKKYDKSMEVTFYGLSNDTDSDNIYYAALYIEDSLSNSIQYIIKFSVSSADSEELQIPFTAAFDCATQSIILNYQDTGMGKPTYKVLSDEWQSYTSESAYPSSGLWDAGISYDSAVSTGGYMNILDINGSDSNPIDYLKGSLIPTSTAEGGDGHGFECSKSITRGVGYSNYFGRGETYLSADNKNELILGEDEDGQFYFDTEFSLNGNYCGEILALNVEKEPDSASADLAIDLTESSNHLDGCITLSLLLPDNFTDPANNNNLSGDRNKMALKIYADRNPSGPSSEHSIMYFFGESAENPYAVFPVPSSHYFYLQNSNVVPSGSSAEYLHYDMTRVHGGCYFWMKEYVDIQGSGSKYYLSSSTKFFGNLNLIKSTEAGAPSLNTNNIKNNDGRSAGAPSYWSEDRAYLIKKEDIPGSNYFVEGAQWHFADPNSTSIDQSTKTLRWPSASDNNEQLSFWNESIVSGGVINNNAIRWGNVNTATSGIETLDAIDRHPSLADNKYRFTAWIYNVSELYEGVSNNDLTAAYSTDDQGSSTGYVISLSRDGEAVGEIRLLPL